MRKAKKQLVQNKHYKSVHLVIGEMSAKDLVLYMLTQPYCL